MIQPVEINSEILSLPAEGSRDHPTLAEESVISVRNVGKLYQLYDRPQDRLKQALFWRLGKHYGRPFWALRDVSFEVRRGEMVGVIGRNGAGKSTLLQIIAGTRPPTTGEVQVRGRVAALLELGSGFNPEFTGRENVFLNGTILGLPRKEIERRFDEIAAFADIGEFLDQPVKVYSSGMFVRLAFAVTTNLDPDVLLIDEALAVGDVFFRQKCYRRLEGLTQQGVSILLVTHSMSTIGQFCPRVVLLDRGKVVFQGPSSEAIKRYYLLEQQERTSTRPSQSKSGTPLTKTLGVLQNGFWPPPEAFFDISHVVQVSNGWAHCTGVALCNMRGEPSRMFKQSERACFFYEFEMLQDIEVPIGGLMLYNDKGISIHGKNTLQQEIDVPRLVTKGSRLRFRQEVVLDIIIGDYTFDVGLASISLGDFESRALYSQRELNDKIVRVCHPATIGHFTVALGREGRPGQLLHHGLVNLPGQSQWMVLEPDTRG
jgi:ABC-type polysaccharide/polyol phosphate transport system ATPase subunit